MNLQLSLFLFSNFSAKKDTAAAEKQIALYSYYMPDYILVPGDNFLLKLENILILQKAVKSPVSS